MVLKMDSSSQSTFFFAYNLANPNDGTSFRFYDFISLLLSSNRMFVTAIYAQHVSHNTANRLGDTST